MKFLLDNNLSPAYARALNELSVRDRHSVNHLRHLYPGNTADIEWITDLKAQGGWAIVSQDFFRKGNLEKKALRECGLVVFCLEKQWSKAQYWEKAHNLVRWWPAIIEQSNLISGGAAFRVPWRISGKGRFEQLPF